MNVAGFEIGASDALAGLAILVSLVTWWRTDRRVAASNRDQKAARFIYQNGAGFSGGTAVDSHFHNIGKHDAYSVEIFVAEPRFPYPELSRSPKVPSGDKIRTVLPAPSEAEETSKNWSAAYRVCYLDGNGPRAQTFQVHYSRNRDRTWKAGARELKKKPWERDQEECGFG